MSVDGADVGANLGVTLVILRIGKQNLTRREKVRRGGDEAGVGSVFEDVALCARRYRDLVWSTYNPRCSVLPRDLPRSRCML